MVAAISDQDLAGLWAVIGDRRAAHGDDAGAARARHASTGLIERLPNLTELSEELESAREQIEEIGYELESEREAQESIKKGAHVAGRRAAAREIRAYADDHPRYSDGNPGLQGLLDAEAIALKGYTRKKAS